ncbi:MAG: vWA domain-containing protein [Candidatus Thorarchaeota archaeon]
MSSISKIDVAFVVDTTGSMRDDIRAVKDSLFDIVKRITKRTSDISIRFAVVSYRDHPPQDYTYVTKIFDFTENLKKIHKAISSLKPSEGGDAPEAVADGLHDARTKLSWSADAYKVLLLVGDAPPHGTDYNNLDDDYWPHGCPAGYDPKKEVLELRKQFGSTVFVFVVGCNEIVEHSFKMIAESVEGGQYFPLSDRNKLPEAILKILEGVSDLIEADRKVLSYYATHDGVFDLGEASSELGLELRQLRTSLSRLLELERIPRWPRGRPLSASQMGIEVRLGKIPDAIIGGKPIKYHIHVKNPSPSVIGVRVVASLISEDGISEIINEPHDIGPRSDQEIELTLVPMAFETGKASIRVEVFYGSQSLTSKVYKTRLY